jgi:hypothetical protein
MEGNMNKKVILSWLSLVTMVATIASSPVAASNMTTSMTGNTSSSGSSENVVQLKPEVQRVGVVVAYSPGQSITIADRHGNEFTFELASPLKIVPAHRANLLGPGAFVTIIAPNNVPGGKHIAVGIVIHRGVPGGFVAPPVTVSPVPPGPTETPTPTPTITPTPTPTNIPDTPIPPDPKPPVEDPSGWSDRSLSTIIGFTFPSDIAGGWTIPLEAAAFLDIQPPSTDGFTEVGMVSVSLEFVPVKFIVEIDVTSAADIVPGRLVSTTSTETVDVNFERIPQIVNPQREEAIYPEFQLDSALTNAATIASDSVCFVVNTTGDGFIRYCSTSDTSTLLSVMDSFPTQYTDLQNRILAAAARIGYTAPLALDQTLSTIEDGQRIQDCANATDELTHQMACTSDIIVARVTSDYFDQKYNQEFGGNNGNNGDNGDNGDHESAAVSGVGVGNATDDDDGEDGDGGDGDGPGSRRTPIDIAVVRILQPIEFPSTNALITVLVQPGDYRVDAWFDANGVFYAATLTGLTTDDILVINQQIPAIPPIFVRASGPEQPLAQISGFDLKICCFGRECR